MSKTNNGIAESKRAELRADADARNAAWQAMPPEHQLADLDAREMTATKQRARIAKAQSKGT